jgi:serine/threonine protein phosphatase PrpC
MHIFGRTDIGKVRETNQDSFIFGDLSKHSCYAVVCDGMGGQNGGNIASQLASNIISEKIKTGFQEKMVINSVKNLMLTAINNANAEIFRMANENKNLEGMGTTVLLVLVINSTAFIANVGDSRLYLLNKDELLQVTKDHSIVQSLVEQGKITKQEAKTHPHKNLITRAVGVEDSLDIDYQEIELSSKQRLLLCTDGLSNLCSDDEIKLLLQNKKLDTICDEMIKLANRNGGNDNITTVIITE